MLRMAPVVVLMSSLSGLPAYGADSAAEPRPAPATAADAAPPQPVMFGVDLVRERPVTMTNPPPRPAVLPALYVSFAALQMFDAYSTSQGLAMGATEANPLMRDTARNPATLWTVKAATTAAAIYAVERMWKKNKAGAIAVMLAATSVSATVAAHNARVLGQLR